MVYVGISMMTIHLEKNIFLTMELDSEHNYLIRFQLIMIVDSAVLFFLPCSSFLPWQFFFPLRQSADDPLLLSLSSSQSADDPLLLPPPLR